MTAKKPRSPAKQPKPNGRPSHVPTDESRATVQALCGFGLGEEAVADYLDISVNTLRKHYSERLRKARPTLMAMASGGLFEALRKKEPWAVKYLHSTLGKQFGWTERQEVTGANGASLFEGLDLTKLNADHLQQLKDILALAGAAI